MCYKVINNLWLHWNAAWHESKDKDEKWQTQVWRRTESKGGSAELYREYIQETLLAVQPLQGKWKQVTFVQSQMNIRWCFPSDRDQSFPTECFL